MAIKELYAQLPGVRHGPRGVLVDVPCIYTFLAASTNAVLTGTGSVHSLTIGAPAAAATLQLWDNLTQIAPQILGVVLIAGQPFTILLDTLFVNGISITMTVNLQITLATRQK